MCDWRRISDFLVSIYHHPCWSTSLFQKCGCAPTILDKDGGGGLRYKPGCAMALIALAYNHGSVSWKMHAHQRKELYDLIDLDKNGEITREEMKAFVKVEENVEKLRAFPRSVHGLILEEIIDHAFERFDEDNNGILDESEWDSMLDVAEIYHLQYLHEVAFTSYRAFFGRDKQWALENNLTVNNKKKRLSAHKERVNTYASIEAMLLRTGPFDKKRVHLLEDKPLPVFICSSDWRSLGRWEDFYYYSANNHPLHGIFACDPNHPLSWVERIVMEIAVFGFMFFSATKKLEWVTKHKPPAYAQWLQQPFMFRLCVESIPSIIFWYILFFLFTSPCGKVDPSNSSFKQVQRAKLIDRFCALMGYLLVITSWVLGYACWKIDVDGLSHFIFMARLQSYVMYWGMYYSIYFNPIFAYGQPNPDKAYNFGDYIGLGQWRVETARYRAICQRVLREHKPRRFMSQKTQDF